MVTNSFKCGNFPLQLAEGTGNPGLSACVTNFSDRFSLKILTPKEVLQRLPIALAQLKAGNISKNLSSVE